MNDKTGAGQEAARVQDVARRRGGDVAIRRACATGGTAGHRIAGSDTAAAQGEWTAAFVQRLRELGWDEGRNIVIEYRWGEGRSERFTEIAAEFVQRKVTLILTHTPPTLAASGRSTIPIVFATAGDPRSSASHTRQAPRPRQRGY